MPKKLSSCEYPCPKCDSKDGVVKNGYARGKRRWRCKNCRYDFISAVKISHRSYHFKYTDLKLLSVLLYLTGVTPEEILKYVLQPIKKTMSNERIIYQWATKVIDGRVGTKVKSEIKIIKISGYEYIKSKIQNIARKFMNNKLRSYMVYINLNNENPNIVVATNGIKQIKETTEPPFWFLILQQVLFSCINSKDACDIFKTDIAIDTEKLYRTKNSRNYNYIRYCKYDGEVLCTSIEKEIIKKRQSRKEVGTNILICFDSSFQVPNVYIFDKALYLIKH